MGMKPPDRWTVPMCRAHHEEQHAIGHRAFDARHRIDSLALTYRYAALSPHIQD
jgi:hypothetical protein